MINKSMNNKVVTDSKDKQSLGPSANKNISVKKPDEVGGLNISSHLKITDPNTGQVLVQKRGDL